MNNFLNFRKCVIDKEQGAVNNSAMDGFAKNFKKHMFEFFGKFNNLLGMALNWKSLNFGDRKVVVNQLVKHALNFGSIQDVKIEYKENDFKTKNTLGSTDGKTVNIYHKLLECDNFNWVVNTTVHEPVHVFQMQNQSTTLSKSTVENCSYHYISPYEDFSYYKKNPIEVEAHKIGDIVSDGFTEKLRKKFGGKMIELQSYFQNSYQQVA